MQVQALPPVTLGVDMLSDETSVLKGAVRVGENVEFDRAGGVRRRAGYALAVSGPAFHSVWSAPQRQEMYAAQAAALQRLSFSPLAAAAIFTLNSADPVEWSEHNGNVFFANRTTAGWIPAGSSAPRALGVPAPSAPTVHTDPAGSLLAGTYMVALSLVDERSEESGLSRWTQVKLTQQGGIVFTNLPVISNYRLRLWCSQRDGDALYLAAEYPAGLSQYMLGGFVAKTRAMHDLLAPMPPGEFCRAFGARVYTARGDTLSYSLPYRYGMHHRITGYVQFNGDITFIEPLAGGIYVGAGNRVWFLAGNDPSQAKQQMVSTCRAVPHSSALVPGEHFPAKLIGTSDPVAVWLSTSGYTVGTPDGRAVELHPDRIRVSTAIASGRTTFVLRDGVKELVTPVAPHPAATGTAIDAVVPRLVEPAALPPSGLGAPTI